MSSKKAKKKNVSNDTKLLRNREYQKFTNTLTI